MAASLMVGVGETYLPVFVLALSGSQLACGLVTTVPLVIGAVLQLGSPWLMRRCGSYRRWVSLCALRPGGHLPTAPGRRGPGPHVRGPGLRLGRRLLGDGPGRQRAVERLDGNARALADAGTLLCLAKRRLPMGHRRGTCGWRPRPATGRPVGDSAGGLRLAVLHGHGQPPDFRRTAGQPAGTATAADRRDPAPRCRRSSTP